MVLIDKQIKELAVNGMVTPFDESLLNSASLDIRVGNKLLLMSIKDIQKYEHLKAQVKYNIRSNRHLIIELNSLVRWEEIDLTKYSHELPFYLAPNARFLVESLETFNLPENVCAMFKLKSSRGREFYEHLEAGWCDNGWHGSKLTMEFVNLNYQFLPIYPSFKIGQMVFFQTDNPDVSYAVKGRYNNDIAVQPSKG